MTTLSTLDPNNVQSVGTVANQAIQSSAPPYAPIVSGTGNPLAGGADNTLATNVAGEIYTQSGDPASSVYGKTPSEHFSSNPIVSTPQDTLVNNAYLQPQNLQSANTATASYAPLPEKTQARGYTS